MLELTGKQKRHLRGLAHDLKPIAHLGKQGLSEAFLRELDDALEHHELVKVKFVEFKDEKKAISRSITEKLGCAEAGRVGHLLILFRPARQEQHRKIRLPKPAA
ncbi:MAG: ribosome assembly RNA-binding protein YhbY [Acidobacteriota bacterium]